MPQNRVCLSWDETEEQKRGIKRKPEKNWETWKKTKNLKNLRKQTRKRETGRCNIMKRQQKKKAREGEERELLYQKQWTWCNLMLRQTWKHIPLTGRMFGQCVCFLIRYSLPCGRSKHQNRTAAPSNTSKTRDFSSMSGLGMGIHLWAVVSTETSLTSSVSGPVSMHTSLC